MLWRRLLLRLVSSFSRHLGFLFLTRQVFGENACCTLYLGRAGAFLVVGCIAFCGYEIARRHRPLDTQECGAEDTANLLLEGLQQFLQHLVAGSLAMTVITLALTVLHARQDNDS